MTLEELKAEAKKHGYKLTKEYPYISLVPCVCGSISRILWSVPGHMHYYQCKGCGFRTGLVKTKYEAKLKWNECVENARKERENV